jgi:uncharacterized protein YndB with AHSA1/START domain
MTEVRVEAERRMAVPAGRVYRAIADYREHHPRFLPPAITDLRVEEGGVGAGTVATFRVRMLGRTSEARIDVTEPEPGRVLAEKDRTRGAVTTFTVDPDGSGSRVRIETRWEAARGIEGWLERLLAPRALRGLYADELARLERYAGGVAD